MAASNGPKILNPYDMMHDAQGFIAENHTYLVIIACFVAIMAAWMLYEIWQDYSNIPKKERSFRSGKHNIMATIRVELLDRIKRKKKKPF